MFSSPYPSLVTQWLTLFGKLLFLVAVVVVIFFYYCCRSVSGIPLSFFYRYYLLRIVHLPSGLIHFGFHSLVVNVHVTCPDPFLGERVKLTFFLEMGFWRNG